MSKIEQYSRILHHRLSTSGLKFTVPTSNDHTDETWLATDLYIGEFGINISDDTVYFRSNNGIKQLGTTGSYTGSDMWSYSGSDVLLSATATSIYTEVLADLGKYDFPWNNLHIGSDPSSNTEISTGDLGLSITQTNGSILTAGAAITSNAPINIYKTSNNSSKTRPLFLNSRYSNIGTSTQVVVAASTNVVVGTSSNNVFVAGEDVNISEGLGNAIHLGYGYSKTNLNSNEVVVGNLAIRGISDDGTGQYSQSDWTTNQSKLRTNSSLTYDLSFIPWIDPTGGEIVQVKAYIIGVCINDSTISITAEIMGGVILDSTPTPSLIGLPVVNIISSSMTGDISLNVDASGVYVKVVGHPTKTIQWLCTYSYHRMNKIY